jgi:hypothetical protein
MATFSASQKHALFHAPIVQRFDDRIEHAVHFAEFGGHQRVRGVEAVTDVVDAWRYESNQKPADKMKREWKRRGHYKSLIKSSPHQNATFTDGLYSLKDSKNN